MTITFRADLDLNVEEGEECGERFREELTEVVSDGSLTNALRVIGSSTRLSDAAIDSDASVGAIVSSFNCVDPRGTGAIVVVPTRASTTAVPTVHLLPPDRMQLAPDDDSNDGGGTFDNAELFIIATLVVMFVICACCAAGRICVRRSRGNSDGCCSALFPATNATERSSDMEGFVDAVFGDDDGNANSREESGDDDDVETRRRLDLSSHESYQIRAHNRVIEWDDKAETGKVWWEYGSNKRRFILAGSPLRLEASKLGTDLRWLPKSDPVRRDLEKCGSKGFDARAVRFRRRADKLREHWTVGRVEFSVRRAHLVEDALAALGELPAEHWRRPFFIGFRGEAGLDAGGLSREFFWHCSREIFEKYFQHSQGNNHHLKDDDEEFDDEMEKELQFVGRFVGKAALEGHHLSAHPSLILLKYMCGEPIALNDLELIDFELWRSLSKLRSMEASVIESLEISFCVESKDKNGEYVTKELVTGGSEINVTSENVDEYLELRFKERVLDVCSKGLTAFLDGVHSVVPLELFLLLSGRELELTLCGVSEVPVDEWRKHTVYQGVFADLGDRHPVIERFWNVIESWDNKKQAMLLQFATGSSCIPCQGFAFLHGRDGALRPFTLTSVELSQAIYPKSHTCFNRIDLPLYRTEDELRSALEFVLSNAAAHAIFSIE